MRAPTMMLFSLVVGTTMLVFTADKLEELMLGGKPVATATPEGPSFSARARDMAATAWSNAEALYRTLTGSTFQRSGDATVELTEETLEKVWVWVSHDGQQRFSRSAPPQEFQAREILHPRGVPLPDEPAAIRSDSDKSTEIMAAEALPDLLLDEQGESLFLEGLRNFRQMQGHPSDSPRP